MFSRMTSAAAIVLALAATPALAEGDAAAGEKVFKKCQACHVLDSDTNKVGPSLQGVMGRQAGVAEGFKFSKAMMEAGEGGLVWNAETIGAYLMDPKGYIKGNRMSFAGLKKDQEVADVIAYIAQFSPEMEGAGDGAEEAPATE